jgi:GH35 family endo-1,4-beta-xylanase
MATKLKSGIIKSNVRVIRRNKKPSELMEFVSIWQSSKSLEEVFITSGMAKKECIKWAFIMALKGVKLKNHFGNDDCLSEEQWKQLSAYSVDYLRIKGIK